MMSSSGSYYCRTLKNQNNTKTNIINNTKNTKIVSASMSTDSTQTFSSLYNNNNKYSTSKCYSN